MREGATKGGRAQWTVDVNARLSERSCKHLPRQRSLCHDTENDVQVLAVEVILPPSDLLVLQQHVEGEQEEEERQGREDVIDKGGY